MPDWSCSKCGWEGPEPDKDTLVIRGGIGTIQLDDGSADILFNSGEIAILRCPECATSTELDKPLLDQ